MKRYSKTRTETAPRIELHDKLGLTGVEISINEMKEGSSVPFIHAHKENEEIYFVLSGKGLMVIDGEDVELEEGDWLKISAEAHRRMFAISDIRYICIQAKSGSLGYYTKDDAILIEE